MNRYQLFREWREVSIIGESFADALTRRGTLQCPDKFAEGHKIEDGEILTVVKVHGILAQEKSDRNYLRGNTPAKTAIVEFGSGVILEVDYFADEIILQ